MTKHRHVQSGHGPASSLAPALSVYAGLDPAALLSSSSSSRLSSAPAVLAPLLDPAWSSALRERLRLFLQLVAPPTTTDDDEHEEAQAPPPPPPQQPLQDPPHVEEEVGGGSPLHALADPPALLSPSRAASSWLPVRCVLHLTLRCRASPPSLPASLPPPPPHLAAPHPSRRPQSPPPRCLA